jgi:hypothetical protein
MEKLINKYEENLSQLLKKHNVDEIMKIMNTEKTSKNHNSPFCYKPLLCAGRFISTKLNL